MKRFALLAWAAAVPLLATAADSSTNSSDGPATRATARIDDFGLRYAATDAFREGVLAADGRIFMIRRNNPIFAIVHPDGRVTQDHLGLAGVALNTSGGARGANGKIYSPPRDSDFVLVIDPATNTATTEDFGLALTTSQNKWTNAVLGDNGKIYCVPSIARTVLVIDTNTSNASAVMSNLGADWAPEGSDTKDIMWVRGVKAPNGLIFCVPFSAPTCLVIDPSTETAILTDFGGVIKGGSGTNKWNGGAVGPDGKIYCAPRNAHSILVIDPVAMTAETKTYGLALSGTDQYARAFAGRDGRIYMPPSGADDILVIDPARNTAMQWAPLDMSGLTSPKWIGGAIGADGNIYCPPRNSQTFLIIEPPAKPDEPNGRGDQ